MAFLQSKVVTISKTIAELKQSFPQAVTKVAMYDESSYAGFTHDSANKLRGVAQTLADDHSIIEVDRTSVSLLCIQFSWILHCKNRKANKDDALSLLTLAQKISPESNDVKGYAEYVSSSIRRGHGEFPEAIKQMESSIQSFTDAKQFDDSDIKAHCYNNIALPYLYSGKLDEAHKYLKLAVTAAAQAKPALQLVDETTESKSEVQVTINVHDLLMAAEESPATRSQINLTQWMNKQDPNQIQAETIALLRENANNDGLTEMWRYYHAMVYGEVLLNRFPNHTTVEELAEAIQYLQSSKDGLAQANITSDNYFRTLIYLAKGHELAGNHDQALTVIAEAADLLPGLNLKPGHDLLTKFEQIKEIIQPASVLSLNA